MSRRHYKKSEQQPLPPFYENLVFWAPLTEGDLTDHISGVSPITDAGCSVTWDADKQMYLLSSNASYGVYKSPLKYDSLGMGLADGQSATLYIEVVEVSAGNNFCAMIVSPYWVIRTDKSGIYIKNNDYGGLHTSRHKYALVYDGKNGIAYQDGLFVEKVDHHSARFSYDNLAICMANDVSNYTIFATDARIYNRALTAEEVA